MKDAIYISHAWEPQSDEILYPLVDRLKKEKFKIIYDHKDLAYRGSISNFMDELAESKAIIIIVSNKYLKSEYCMYELLKIYEEKDIQERIYPIVLEEVDIAKSTDRLELVKYWEKEAKELSSKIKELDDIAFIEGITDDLNLYKSIRNKIAKLTYILRDINSLQVDIHAESNFEALVHALKKNKFDRPTAIKRLPTLKPIAKNTFWPIASILLLLITGYFIINYFNFSSATKEISSNDAHDLQRESINDKANLAEETTSESKILDSINNYEELSVKKSTKVENSNEKSSQVRTPDLSATKRNIEKEIPTSIVVSETELKEERTDDNSVLNSDKPEDIEEPTEPIDSPMPQKEDNQNQDPETSFTLINVKLSKNTSLVISPKELISSKFLLKGDRVYFRVIDPVSINDVVVIEENADAVGYVVRAQSFANSKRAILELKLESVQASDGGSVPLYTTLLQTSRKFEIEFETHQTIEAKTLQDANIKVKVPF